MLAIHGAAQGLESIRILIVAAAILTVIFWKIFLQILIITVMILIFIGAVNLVQGILHIVK